MADRLKICWVTDPHLEFLNRWDQQPFLDRLARQAGDAFLITGDIADSIQIGSVLDRLAQSVRKPVYFVLGNHDFYQGSVRETNAAVDGQVAKHFNLDWLQGREIIELGVTTALIGIGGWADGLGGLGPETPRRVADFEYINDLSTLANDYERFSWMRNFANRDAAQLKIVLEEAMAKYAKVIVATHVPPFEEAAWYEGTPSEPDYQPFFSSPTMGKMLLEAAREHPEQTVDVYCGHTHGKGIYTIANITVFTGDAEYREPKINGIIEL